VPGLEPLLDEQALLARHRAVVGVDYHLSGQLVQRRGQPLGETPAVDEDERGAVRPDELEDERVHGRPDAAAAWPLQSPPAWHPVDLGETRHVLHRHLDAEIEGLDHTGVHDGHWPRHPALEPAEKMPGLVQRALGGREPDPLQAAFAERLQPFERQSQMGPPLRADQSMYFVDDHRPDGPERIAGATGEEQVERLGRRYQYVRGRPEEPRPLAARRVAGADGHRGAVSGHSERLRALDDAGQGRPEVAFHVHRQRPERGDVEHAAALGHRRHRLEHQPIDSREERGERLPRAGRGQEQRRLAALNRRPTFGLYPRGLSERGPHPRSHRLVEAVEAAGAAASGRGRRVRRGRGVRTGKLAAGEVGHQRPSSCP
jgi:hypothetical protein